MIPIWLPAQTPAHYHQRKFDQEASLKYSNLPAVFLLSPAVIFTQHFFPAKDMAFARVPAGAGYETVIN